MTGPTSSNATLSTLPDTLLSFSFLTLNMGIMLLTGPEGRGGDVDNAYV